jgi:hypothetical protein
MPVFCELTGLPARIIGRLQSETAVSLRGRCEIFPFPGNGGQTPVRPALPPRAAIGPDQAAEYLMTTRLPSDPKAASDFKYAIVQISRSYARRGNLKAAKDWTNKLPEADRSSEYNVTLEYLEESKRKQIRKLCVAGQFKEAIAEARQLQSLRDRELYGIVIGAVNAKDLNSALEAARLIGEDASKVGAYTSIIKLI